MVTTGSSPAKMAGENSTTSENMASTGTNRFRGTHVSDHSKGIVPALPWSEVLLALECGSTYVSPNVVRFTLPAIKKEERALARAQLAHHVRIAFPATASATVVPIRFPEGGSGYERYIDIEARKDIVDASEIVSAAATKRWSVLGKPLGPPALIGAKIPDDHYVIRISNIPNRRYVLLMKSLDALLAQALSRSSSSSAAAIEIVDVFLIQEFLPLVETWISANSVAIVVRLPTNSNIPALAYDWPGYILWDSMDLLTLEYMNRYNYCEICKHTAQELDGPNARHETSACPKRTGQHV